jgi:hypothetical protein
MRRCFSPTSSGRTPRRSPGPSQPYRTRGMWCCSNYSRAKVFAGVSAVQLSFPSPNVFVAAHVSLDSDGGREGGP